MVSLLLACHDVLFSIWTEPRGRVRRGRGLIQSGLPTVLYVLQEDADPWQPGHTTPPGSALVLLHRLPASPAGLHLRP